jgi:hypothetical protein
MRMAETWILRLSLLKHEMFSINCADYRPIPFCQIFKRYLTSLHWPSLSE